MSQNGPFLLAPWNVAFGPALCLPHLVEKNWLFPGRLYVDDGHWMSVGATIPLAPITHPEAQANLGIRLTNTRAAPASITTSSIAPPAGGIRAYQVPHISSSGAWSTFPGRGSDLPTSWLCTLTRWPGQGRPESSPPAMSVSPPK